MPSEDGLVGLLVGDGHLADVGVLQQGLPPLDQHLHERLKMVLLLVAVSLHQGGPLPIAQILERRDWTPGRGVEVVHVHRELDAQVPRFEE
jgi:hypothetical protein